MLVILLLLTICVSRAAEPLVLDETHESQIFGETRHYRIFLPGDYATSGKRYPVIYWFHGWSERYNKPVRDDPHRNYDQGEDYDGNTIARFVGTHDVIVVKWDGYNPRTPDENYPRPYNISPVETDRQFPIYFPELVTFIDAHYRTIADREHRATSGLSMGGFMSFWVAGKYPHLISSASNFMGSSEFSVGPRGFDVEYRHEEMHGNYDGVRTRLVTGTRDFIRFYHQRMIGIWKYTRPFFETQEYDADHGTPHMSDTFDFHMRAFAEPLPRPAVWNHIDAYPNFSMWGWQVASDRKQPGLTVLETVSPAGLRSSVREWLPSGRVLPNVKLWIASDGAYPPNKPQLVTVIRLRDGKVRRASQHADAEGRLWFELDGDEYEVGIGPGPILALGNLEVLGAPWASDAKPVSVRVQVWNKGAALSKAATLRWETANQDIDVKTPTRPMPEIQPGGFAATTLLFTVRDPAREIVKFFAVVNNVRLPVEIPMFPTAAPAREFQIADGRAFTVFQEGVKRVPVTLGSGNGDGRANAGEMIAILLPDGDSYRAAELFTNDWCVDLTRRISDSWSSYDHVGASAKYSLPMIKPGCPAGHVVHMMARIQLPNAPNHRIVYSTIEFPVSAVAASRPGSSKTK
jgi:hypothetical protein